MLDFAVTAVFQLWCCVETDLDDLFLIIMSCACGRENLSHLRVLLLRVLPQQLQNQYPTPLTTNSYYKVRQWLYAVYAADVFGKI